jgi:P-type Cu+ transporter
LKDPYKEAVVPIEQVHAGDIVKVIRGAAIPADGFVLFGEISVDESMVTGESMPVLKTPGAIVLGGTICIEGCIGGGVLEADPDRDVGGAFVQVTGVGSDTALAQIVQMVHAAQTRAVPIQSYADRVSSIFVPTVCCISLLTFLVWYALCISQVVPESWYKDLGENSITFSLMFAISCLVISCPCALGLATPTAVMVGTGVSAKIGILMKGGEALEIANKVDSVIFDKTGTLTKGAPAVCDFLRLDDQSNEDEVLWLLGTLERSSEHPLARAVVQFAEQRLGDKLNDTPFGQPTQFRAVTGRGATGNVDNSIVSVGNRAFAEALGHDVSLVAEECMVSLEEDGKTAILVFVDGAVSGILGIADQIKVDAAASIAYLRDVLGVDVWIVTGDNARTARSVSKQLGVPFDRVIAEALPAAKLEQVLNLQAEGKVVAMVRVRSKSPVVT